MILEQIRKWAWVIITVAVIIIALLFYDSCRANTKSEYYKGKYEAEYTLREAENSAATERIEYLEGEIEGRDAEIHTLIETRIEHERNMSLLYAKYELLLHDEPEQPELESEPLVVNLRAQVRQLSLVIDSQELIIQGNDEIIFNLTQKYQAQLKISGEYKKMYDSEVALHVLAIKRLKVADKHISSLRFTGNVKNVLVIAGGVMAYLLLK